VLLHEEPADLVEERGGILLGVDQQADGDAVQVPAAPGARGADGAAVVVAPVGSRIG